MPSLVEIGQGVLDKKNFKFCQIILTQLLLSFLGKGCDSSFEQSSIPFTLKCFVPSLVEIRPLILERKKMRKMFDNDETVDDNDNDDYDDGQRTSCDQNSSFVLSAHVS